MAYQYDIFLSYPHGFIEKWVIDNFMPFLKWHLEGSLGRPPEIFLDRDGISTGDTCPLRLKKALAHSRCLVAIWAPSYFKSEWCVRECRVMSAREQQEGYRTIDNPSGLIQPVNVCDGKSFPDFAKNIQYFDCRDFAILGQGFEKTELYVTFQNEIRQWCENVAESVNNSPQWKDVWLNDDIIQLPNLQNPNFELPTLG